MGGDEEPFRGDFYPRSPCGERLGSLIMIGGFGADFYPRSPCGERPSRLDVKY